MLSRTRLGDFTKHYPPVQTPFGTFLMHFASATIKKSIFNTTQQVQT